MIRSLVCLAVMTLALNACEGSQFAEDKSSIVKSLATPKSSDAQNQVQAVTISSDASQNSETVGEDGSGDVPEGIKIKGGDAEGEGCIKVSGQKDLHISGSENEVTLNDQTITNVKVTGSLNQVGLTLNSGAAAGSKASGSLCLFVAGNQNEVSIRVEGQVETIFIKARGNSPKIDIDVIEGAALKSLDVDARGNQPTITVRGEGTFPKQ